MVSFRGQVKPELRPEAQFRFSDEHFRPFNIEVLSPFNIEVLQKP